jgi:putative endonuclease
VKTRSEKGKWAEEQALTWFLSHRKNSSLIGRNFYCKAGEIDLIFEEKVIAKSAVKCVTTTSVELVFVEVRLCTKQNWLIGPETVSIRKQQRLVRAARLFLSQYRGKAQSIRFDLVHGDGNTWQHIPNCWLLDGESRSFY